MNGVVWILPHRNGNMSQHSVETSSMVDPQWNMFYWGPRCNSHTACWGAVWRKWGTTSVCVCFIPRMSLSCGPSTYIDLFYLRQRRTFEGHKQNPQEIPCRFKMWMGFVGQILIKFETSFIRGFPQFPFDVLLGITSANTLVGPQWPPTRSPPLHSSVCYGSLEA